VGGSGVQLSNEIGSFYEVPLPGKTVIRNNSFQRTFLDSIRVFTNGKAARARDITITGNRITGWHTDPKAIKTASAIHLSNVTGAIIGDNTIGKSAADPGISTPVLLTNCKDVMEKDNQTHMESNEGNPDDF